MIGNKLRENKIRNPLFGRILSLSPALRVLFMFRHGQRAVKTTGCDILFITSIMYNKYSA